ncbi:hypothetical protein TPA0906_00950 [Streptomyces olivaceus]|nr:hypothetical protein TPA0906_00950 [Streptomyces olivaceus]
MDRTDHLEHLDRQLVDELAQAARETVRDELREHVHGGGATGAPGAGTPRPGRHRARGTAPGGRQPREVAGTAVALSGRAPYGSCGSTFVR